LSPCSKQLALLGPLRPQPTKIWKRKFVKLMVVGDSGLGKTTLISALLSKPGEQLQVRTRLISSLACVEVCGVTALSSLLSRAAPRLSALLQMLGEQLQAY
jgi:septin family protein